MERFAKVFSSLVFSVVFSVFLSLFGSQNARAEDSHSHHEAGGGVPVKLELNHGKKWKTDKALRSGMTRIAQLMEDDIRSIRQGTLSEAASTALSQKVTLELNQIFKNCKLKAEADAALHLVLVQAIAGAAQMNSGQPASGRRDGALKIVGALEQYAKFFDHPGWMAIRE